MPYNSLDISEEKRFEKFIDTGFDNEINKIYEFN